MSANRKPTATKALVNPRSGRQRSATSEELTRMVGGLARIGIRSDGLRTWVEHRKVSGIRTAMARGLVRAAAEAGSNEGWLVHYGAVPRARWIAVQRFDRWVDMSDTSPMQERGEK